MSYTPHPVEQALKKRILILDGTMGTMIQRYQLDEAAYRGERFWRFGISRPVSGQKILGNALIAIAAAKTIEPKKRS